MKKKLKVSFIVSVICFCLIGVAVVSIISMQIRLNDLDEEKAAYEKEKKRIEEHINEIKYQLDKPLDDDFIIRIARQRLGYHLPGEKVYIFEKESK